MGIAGTDFDATGKHAPATNGDVLVFDAEQINGSECCLVADRDGLVLALDDDLPGETAVLADNNPVVVPPDEYLSRKGRGRPHFDCVSIPANAHDSQHP